MAQLRYYNVAAPDLSGTSNILANAGRTLNDSLSSASALLDKYKAGQQEINDNSLLTEIASINSEEDLTNYLNSGALEGKNISQKMRETVLGLRKGVLGYEQDRATIKSTEATTQGTNASTQNTLARTAIANAAEGRTANEYADKVASRNELRGLTGAAVAANIEGNTKGRFDGIPRTAVQNSVYQGLIKRGLPAHVAQGFMMNFQDESGFVGDRVEAAPNVHGTRGKGFYQLTGARREAFEKIYGDDYSTDNQLDFLVSELGGSESAAAQKIFSAKTPGEAASYIVNDFLRPAEEHRARRSAKYLGTPVNSRPAFNNLQEAIAKSVNLNPAQALELLSQAYTAQNSGQARLDESAGKARNEASATAILEAARNPEAVTQQNVTTQLLNDPRFTTSQDKLNAIERSRKLLEGGLGDVLRPAGSSNVGEVIQNTVTSYNNRVDRELEAAVPTRLIARADSFGDDPTKGLKNLLDIGKDGETPNSNWFFANHDENTLRTLINDVARESGVSPALAASAMAEIFERDPTGNNSDAARFNKQSAIDYVKTNLSQEALTRFDERKLIANSRKQQLSKLVLELGVANSSAKKYGANVPAKLSQEIQNLERQILQATRSGSATTQSQVIDPGANTAAAQLANFGAQVAPGRVSGPPEIQPTAPQISSLVPDAQIAQDEYAQKEWNQLQLREYIDVSGVKDQLSRTRPGSPERRAIVQELLLKVQNDQSITDEQKASIIAAIQG